jgi:hypothetical protein
MRGVEELYEQIAVAVDSPGNLLTVIVIGEDYFHHAEIDDVHERMVLRKTGKEMTALIDESVRNVVIALLLLCQGTFALVPFHYVEEHVHRSSSEFFLRATVAQPEIDRRGTENE